MLCFRLCAFSFTNKATESVYFWRKGDGPRWATGVACDSTPGDTCYDPPVGWLVFGGPFDFFSVSFSFFGFDTWLDIV